jgi:hypothetical protein
MWGSVLGLAFLAALDPVRLGITLLVLTRPRPVQNLLAYWLGSLTGCIPGLVIPLTVLNVTPMFRSAAEGMAHPEASSTVRHIQIGMGVLALLTATIIAIRILARQRTRRVMPGAGTTSTMVRESGIPLPIARLLARTRSAGMEGGSVFRRLLGRVYNSWENGSLWVAWVIGAWLAGPQPDTILFLLAILATSGAVIGTQVSAAIAFVVGMLAIVEIVLVSYMAAPTKTQEALRLLHDWVSAHRQEVLATLAAMTGFSLVAHGMGTI